MQETAAQPGGRVDHAEHRDRRTAGELMTAPTVGIAPSGSLRAAAQRLRDADVGALAVLDHDGRPGVLSERDIVRALAAGADPDTTPVADAMTPDAWAIDVGCPLWAATTLMLVRGIRHVPVVGGGRVVGMVSIRDALQVLEDERHVGPRVTMEAFDGPPRQER